MSSNIEMIRPSDSEKGGLFLVDKISEEIMQIKEMISNCTNPSSSCKNVLIADIKCLEGNLKNKNIDLKIILSMINRILGYNWLPPNIKSTSENILIILEGVEN